MRQFDRFESEMAEDISSPVLYRLEKESPGERRTCEFAAIGGMRIFALGRVGSHRQGTKNPKPPMHRLRFENLVFRDFFTLNSFTESPDSLYIKQMYETIVSHI